MHQTDQVIGNGLNKAIPVPDSLERINIDARTMDRRHVPPCLQSNEQVSARRLHSIAAYRQVAAAKQGLICQTPYNCYYLAIKTKKTVHAGIAPDPDPAAPA